MHGISGELIFFSSCPERYIWILGCTSPHGPKRDMCALENVTLSLEIVKGNLGSAEANRDPRSFLNNFPMAQAVQDLCPTGIKFGAPDMEWFYTFGRSGKPSKIFCLWLLLQKGIVRKFSCILVNVFCMLLVFHKNVFQDQS